MIRKKYVTIPWILQQERMMRSMNKPFTVNWFNLCGALFMIFIVGVLVLRYLEARRERHAETPAVAAAPSIPKNILFFNV